MVFSNPFWVVLLIEVLEDTCWLNTSPGIRSCLSVEGWTSRILLNVWDSHCFLVLFVKGFWIIFLVLCKRIGEDTNWLDTSPNIRFLFSGNIGLSGCFQNVWVNHSFGVIFINVGWIVFAILSECAIVDSNDLNTSPDIGSCLFIDDVLSTCFKIS